MFTYYAYLLDYLPKKCEIVTLVKNDQMFVPVLYVTLTTLPYVLGIVNLNFFTQGPVI